MKVFGALFENCSPVKKEFGSQPGKALYNSAPQINVVVVGRLQKKTAGISKNFCRMYGNELFLVVWGDFCFY